MLAALRSLFEGAPALPPPTLKLYHPAATPVKLKHRAQILFGPPPDPAFGRKFTKDGRRILVFYTDTDD